MCICTDSTKTNTKAPVGHYCLVTVIGLNISSFCLAFFAQQEWQKWQAYQFLLLSLHILLNTLYLLTWDLGGNMSLVFSSFVNLTAKFFANRNLLASNVSKFVILEFQGPYGPLGNSSPCGGHARSVPMASCFARKVTLEDMDFL